MADYRSLENKIKDIVGRPWTKDPKQTHHKQQQIQKKIIDEEPNMLDPKALGIPDSVVEAAKKISKKTEVEINPQYKPAVDQDEELVGKQHKIDANKNGKIDADDFKKLRSKTLKEGPPTSSDPDFAAPRAPGSPSNDDEIKYKPEPKKPEQKKPVPPLPPKRPSNLNTESAVTYSGTPRDKRVVFTGSPSHTSKKAEDYKKRGYEIERIKKGPSGIFGDNSEKHTYSMVWKEKDVKEEKAKPDFLDMDKDGNKKESMKKAVSDKKKVAKEEVAFSDEELAKLNDIAEKENVQEFVKTLAPAVAKAAAKSADDMLKNTLGGGKVPPKPPTGGGGGGGGNGGGRIPGQPDTPRSPGPWEPKPFDPNKSASTTTSSTAASTASSLKDKIKNFANKAINDPRAILGLQATHDVAALATGQDAASQAMKDAEKREKEEKLNKDIERARAPAGSVKAEETIFSDEELANLNSIAEKENIQELAPLALAGAGALALGRAAAPAIGRALGGAAARGGAAGTIARGTTRAPKPKGFEPDVLPKPGEAPTIPRPSEVPGAPRPAEIPGAPRPTEVPAPPKPSTPGPGPTPAPTTPAPNTPKPAPTRPGKPGKLPKINPKNPNWRMPDTNIPDMTDAPPQDDTNTKTKPDVDTGPSSNPDPGPAPRDDTGTKPPENVSPRVTPPVTPPVSAPPADRNAPTSCTTCGPQTYVRTYGRTEPRVGSPSGIQPQTNSYDPKVKGKSIKEANLAAQIRDAKPSLTGHIEVDVGGGKKVKVPHRKAQEFLGSYHSKRTPNEKDEHEKAFRREIGG